MVVYVQAIRDGGVDASLNHGDAVMVSKDAGDIYSTVEPQAAFHSRIAFCLNTHNEAIKVGGWGGGGGMDGLYMCMYVGGRVG